MSLLIGPGTVVTADGSGRVLAQGGVLVAGNRVAAVGDFTVLQLANPAATVLDAAGGTITPGLINAHTHFYGLFARGMALKDPPPATFRQILERVWWRLDKALDHEAVYLSAMFGSIAALRSGCTTVVDHHAGPNAIAGSLDRIAAATAEVGLRACLCYEVSDRDGPERAAAGIAENARFLERVAGGAGGRLRGLFGLHAAFTVSDQTLAESRAAARATGAGFHIHCAEGPEDEAHSQVHHGLSVVERLLNRSILGPETILGHCVHISEADMGLLAETGTTVSHQPHSNMGNAVGWSRLLRMQERGVPVALGTDGYNWDMLETMRTAAAMHAHMTGAPGAGVGEFAGVLLAGNARLVSRMYGEPVGRLEPGALADLVIWDYYPPTPLTAGNLPWHMQFGMSGAQARTVLVDGRVVLRDRQLPGIDEAALARQARAVAARVWERF
jgi:putative selenium metabolism protein SsnA